MTDIQKQITNLKNKWWNDDLKTILGSLYDDYDFIAIEEQEAISKILKKMEKNEDENDEALIGEVYLH